MAGLSVVICTHNRAGRLEQALASLCAAVPPRRGAWEVVAVLNDCTDESGEIVESYRQRLPIIAIVESRRGLSYARNRAVSACRGDFIVFIDDDARVSPSFLVAYETAFANWPEDDVFSGPIEPVFEEGAPKWLERALPAVGSAFAMQRVACDAAPIEPAGPPYGCNFAIRSTVQRQWSYDPELGRGGVSWVRSGEETQVLRAVFGNGSSGRWVAAASVQHIIPPERQTLGYIWRYYEGYGMVLGRDSPRHRSRSIIGTATSAAKAELVYRASRLLDPPERWAAAMVRAAIRRGTLRGRFLRRHRLGQPAQQ